MARFFPHLLQTVARAAEAGAPFVGTPAPTAPKAGRKRRKRGPAGCEPCKAMDAAAKLKTAAVQGRLR